MVDTNIVLLKLLTIPLLVKSKQFRVFSKHTYYDYCFNPQSSFPCNMGKFSFKKILGLVTYKELSNTFSELPYFKKLHEERTSRLDIARKVPPQITVETSLYCFDTPYRSHPQVCPL